MSNKPVRIGIVVGETSGDILGSGLIAALKQKYPNAQFEGIAGERMQALGMPSMFPMERLAVMGLIEPLKRLPELLSIRKQLRQHFLNTPPDVFIGIDAPDFNLGVELPLKEAGIKTVHYVSPSVWAWRQKRIFKIKRCVDLMLCLLPFEAKFYEQHDVPVRFVGHSLAKELQFSPKPELGERPLVCLMAGSRKSEVQFMAALYFDVASQLLKQNPTLQFVVPAANEARMAQLEEILAEAAAKDPLLASAVTLRLKGSHEAMANSHLVICTSGTTTLEAMLLGKPMVIAYRMAALNYRLLIRFFKAPFFGLPNLLADKRLVPELLQDDASVDAITQEASRFLNDDDYRHDVIQQFSEIKESINLDASAIAAEEISTLIESR